MSESRFTPGPWSIEKYHIVGPKSEADDQSYGMMMPVAYVEQYDHPESHKANARLIAAAPELLEALEKAVSEGEQAEFERWLSKEAPSGDCEAVQRQWEESAIFRDFHSWWGAAIAAIAKARGES